MGKAAVGPPIGSSVRATSMHITDVGPVWDRSTPNFATLLHQLHHGAASL
jgi:hypothetical protein